MRVELSNSCNLAVPQASGTEPLLDHVPSTRTTCTGNRWEDAALRWTGGGSKGEYSSLVGSKDPKKTGKSCKSWGICVPQLLMILIVFSFTGAAICGAVFDWHGKHHRHRSQAHHHRSDSSNETGFHKRGNGLDHDRTLWAWLFGGPDQSHTSHRQHSKQTRHIEPHKHHHQHHKGHLHHLHSDHDLKHVDGEAHEHDDHHTGSSSSEDE
ncbi:expressed unknown protein [Seminavis robusta]|uniref:Uncharacterized protein n=1 Tax=Seminavis robusta TaxID=568900 RepID=A0A9N8DWG7_9STRA|nr:expressed unknown protein [Seminavis robusta]|eukprot:Sro428_g140850.1 n/a (210) ;mRNA; f:25678-26475